MGKIPKKHLIRILDALETNPLESLAPPLPQVCPHGVDWPDWVFYELEVARVGQNILVLHCNLVTV